MPRNRSPNREKAFKIFKRHKGNIANKTIAEILEEDPKTISKWKQLDEWEKKTGFSKEKAKKSKKEMGNASTNGEFEKSTIDMSIEKELNEIEEIEELNEKMLLFCIYYVQCFNATKAYQRAYQCGKTTAHVNGCKLLAKTNIQITIAKLKQNRLNRAMIDPSDVFQKYMDIAFADITDYITFGKMDVLTGQQADGTMIYQKVNYVDYKNSEDIDGTLVTEFKEGKNGFSIKLMDRMKALDWIAEHMGMATEEQKAKVESLKNKVRVENETMEMKKKQMEKDDW